MFAEQQFCFALHIALEAARLPISSFSPPLSGHMTHTQAERFYNFAYVRRFLVLVRFKNRPHVLNLTDVTPCPRVFSFSILERASSKVDCEYVSWSKFNNKVMATNDIEKARIELEQTALNSEIVYHYLENCTEMYRFFNLISKLEINFVLV